MKHVGNEKGFTLIELLIVVAILGVLAAVVIPNVGRFIGRGETEADATEFGLVQTAVISMMADNNVQSLPNPVTVATADMSVFPDAITPATDKSGGAVGDKPGYVLWQHDVNLGDSAQTGLVNYVLKQTTSCAYTVDTAGTVTQLC